MFDLWGFWTYKFIFPNLETLNDNDLNMTKKFRPHSHRENERNNIPMKEIAFSHVGLRSHRNLVAGMTIPMWFWITVMKEKTIKKYFKKESQKPKSSFWYSDPADLWLYNVPTSGNDDLAIRRHVPIEIFIGGFVSHSYCYMSWYGEMLAVFLLVVLVIPLELWRIPVVAGSCSWAHGDAKC